MAETLSIELKSSVADGLLEIIKEMQQLEAETKTSAQALTDMKKSMEEVVEATTQAKDASNDFGKAVKSAKEEVKAAGEVVADLNDNSEKIDTSMKKAEEAVSKFDESVKKNTKAMKDMVKDKYKLALEAVDKVSPALKLVNSKIKTLTGKAWKVTLEAINLVTPSVKDVIKHLKETFSKTKAILGIDIGLKDTIDTFASFEAAMSRVKVLAGATNGEFAQLAQKAKEMGQATKFTATESAGAFAHMASNGWEVADMLSGIDSVMALSEISGESLTGISDILVEALTAFGLGTKEVEYFSDVLAQTAVNSRSSISEIGAAFKSAGAVSSSLGYGIQDVAAALGLMVESGLKGFEAGKALDTILTRLSANTDGAADAIQALGVGFFNSDGSARDLSLVMSELRHATANMSEEQKANLAKTIAGMEAQKGLQAILNATTEGYDELTEAIEDAEGAAKQMAGIVGDNLQGAFTTLQGALEGVKITLGERLKPYIQSFTIWLGNKMPDIEKAIGKVMGSIDKKMIQLRYTIKRMMNSTEWEDADIFGKVSIAWGELIGNPFLKWWNGTGKRMIADAMGTIGKGIGMGLGIGLMTILGFDISGAVDEGLSIGKSFASGFSDGFSGFDIKSSILGAVKGIFSSAGGILSADSNILNWISALLVGKTAISAGKGIGSGIGAGMKAYRGASKIWGSVSTAAELAGVGSMTGTGIIGGLAHLGLGMNGLTLASSGAGLAGVGAAGVAGGVLATATVISAVKDLKTAYETNGDERNVNLASAGMKLGGVGVGAAIGTMILPGIGTLVGAGIGGAMGWYSGNKAKASYEEELEKAEQRAYAFALAEEQAKYESIELKMALADTTISTAEFAKMLDDIVAKDMASRFGDITLSLAEIQELAEKITFGESITSLKKFSDASYQARNDYRTLVNSLDAMDKVNWQAGFGNMSSEEMKNYKSSIESVLSSSKNYLTSRHYEVTTAIRFLYENEDSTELIASVNEIFLGLQNQLAGLNNKLMNKVGIQIKSGVLNLDVNGEIMSLMQQINEITEMVSDIEMSSNLELLSAKYGGANLNADSFMSFQMELGPMLEEQIKTAEDAFKNAAWVANYKLANDEDYGDKQYQEDISTAKQLMEDKKNNWVDQSLTYQLGVITDKYGTELGSVLPDFDGTMIEQLVGMIQSAKWNGTDFSKMEYNELDDLDEIAKLFNLQGLKEEPQKAIAELLLLAAQSIPDVIFETIDDTIMEVIKEAYEFLPLGSNYSASHYGGFFGRDVYNPAVENAIELSEEKGVRYPMFGDDDAEEIIESLNRALETKKWLIRMGFDPVADEALQVIKDKLSDINVETVVNITADYNVTNPKPWANPIIRKPGASDINPIYNAAGGFINQRVLSWIGEEGPEAIIPLVPGRRGRGLELWKQTGKLLGVGGYVNDGIVGGNDTWPDASLNYDYGVSNYSGSDGDISIQINMNPSFDIQSSGGFESSEERIVDTIKGHLGEMADELSGEIATTLEQIFSNMPKKVLI